MTVNYTLDDNTCLNIFLWTDVMGGETYRKVIEVIPIYNGKPGRKCNKELKKDDKGVYILWNDKPVYLNDYDYYTAEQLIDKLEEVKGNIDVFLSDSDICATFMKETDKIGIVLDMPAFDIRVPELGIGFTGGKRYSTLVIPTEKQYKKSEWFYKVTLECENPELRKYIPYNILYFSDLASFLRSGHAKLVLREQFKDEVAKKYKAQKHRQKSLKRKLGRMFGKTYEEEQLPLIGL